MAAARTAAVLVLALASACAVVAFGVARRGAAPALAPRYRPVAPLFDPTRSGELEGRDRDAWQQPARIVKTLRLRPGQTVADVGAGDGYLESHLSRAVGPGGTVYAEEIQKAFLRALERRARRLGNVRVVLGTADDPKLPPGSADRIVLLTVYHEVQQPVPFLRALRRALAPGGRLAIIDFDPYRHGYPPPPAEHSVPERDVLAEAAAAGWEREASYDFIPSQFFLVFRAARK